MFTPVTYTPDQVAEILQLSTSTVYGLIERGEIVAKKIGKVYRIPANAISFALTGLDYDLSIAEQEDRKSIGTIQSELKRVRKTA